MRLLKNKKMDQVYLIGLLDSIKIMVGVLRIHLGAMGQFRKIGQLSNLSIYVMLFA